MARGFGLVFDKDIEVNFKSIPSDEQRTDYFVGAEAECNDILLIQSSTESLKDVEEILPWRSVLIVDCTENGGLLSASVKFHRRRLLNKVTGKNLRSLLILGKELKPITVVNINGKNISVCSEKKTRNYIINLDQWLNIQNKQFSAERGVFSMFNPTYKNIFTNYAQQLPFSQNILLQLVPMGSKLDAESSISPMDRARESPFLDYIYCGGLLAAERKCDGGTFAGNFPGKHTFKGEQHQNEVLNLINRLFNDINFGQYGVTFKNAVTPRVRTLVSEYAQYTDRIGQSGCFASNPIGAWVSTKASNLGLDNELPHEFGHTYGLPDWTGEDTFEYKHKDFQLNLDNSLSLPFFADLQYKRGSMNGGVADHTDKYFTSLTAFDKKLVTKRMLSSEDIDSHIIIDPNASHETILIVQKGNDVLAYKINVLIPSVIRESKQPFCTNNDYIQIQSFDRFNKLEQEINYNIHLGFHKIVALPQNFLPANGYIKLRRPHKQVSRRLFTVDQTIKLDPPFKGNYKEAFADFSERILKTPSELKILQHEDQFAAQFAIFDSLIVVSSYKAPLDSVKVPILTNEQISKTLTIYNNAANPITVALQSYDDTVIAPKHAMFLTFGNGWREVLIPAAPTRTLQMSSLASLDKHFQFPQELYSPNYRNLKVSTLNGFWKPYFVLHSLSADYLTHTIEFHCQSDYSFDVIISGAAKNTLRKGESKIFEFTNGWQFEVESVNAIPDLEGDSSSEIPSSSSPHFVKLFQNALVLKRKVTSTCNRETFDLPDMDRAMLGRQFILRNDVAASIVRASSQFFTVQPLLEYTFRFSNPWKVIGKNSASITSTTLFNVTNQKRLHFQQPFSVNTLEELVKFKDYTYVFQVFERFDVIDIYTFDGCWVPTLFFHPNAGYFQHVFKVVRIFVKSTWPVTLDFYTSTEKLSTGDQRSILLDVGWQITQIK